MSDKFSPGDYLGKGKVVFSPTENEALNNQWYWAKILAYNIYTMRKDRGWSQVTLAEIAGIHPYQICKIETDYYYRISLRTIGLISRALGVTVGDLFVNTIGF